MLSSLFRGLPALSFNTASGKYYCNPLKDEWTVETKDVSIPQAVSTIAIELNNKELEKCSLLFQYRKR